jgi:hypothetical protein
MVELYLKIIWTLLYSEYSLENNKKEILSLANEYGLSILSVKEYAKIGGFMVLCKATLERAIASFLEANSYEETIKNVLFIGSDTDTTSCIAGCLAELSFGIPQIILDSTIKYFNHKNISILKNVNKMYLLNKNNNFSTQVKINIFNDEKIKFYDFINELNLTDPTAEWDPLTPPNEINDFYSKADIALQKENMKRQNILTRIMYYFKNKSST